MSALELAVFLVLFVLFKTFRNRHFSAKISQFNSPTWLEIIKVPISTALSPPELFETGHKWLEKYGCCFKLNTIIDTFVCTGKREDTQILFKIKEKGRLYHYFEPAMGAGILTANGQKWKRCRTILESAYAHRELFTNFLPIFNKQSCLLVDEIHEKGLGVKYSLWPLILRASTRTNSETIIGSGDLQIPREYESTSRRAGQLLMKRVYSPWLYPEFMFKFYLYLTNQSRVFDGIRKHFAKAIKKRRQMTLENEISASKNSPSTGTVIFDFLAKKDLTDEDLIEELMTLMFAGSETVATGISYTLLMLAMNPDIQEKVYEELTTVFSDDKNKDAEISDLLRLKFLEQCIKESLRKLSIIPFIERHVTSDVTLSDGRVVPGGANIALSIYRIHNDPEYYPNPEVWNPYNFDEDAVAKRPNNTFIPFAFGMRQCVGKKSGMMCMKIFLSRILRNFKVTTDQTEAKLEYNLIVRCRSGYYLKFEKR